jgi:hypothetical protein
VCCSYRESVINPLLGNGWRRQQAGRGLAAAAVNCIVRESVKYL